MLHYVRMCSYIPYCITQLVNQFHWTTKDSNSSNLSYGYDSTMNTYMIVTYVVIYTVNICEWICQNPEQSRKN